MPSLYDDADEACRRAGFVPDAVQKDAWLMQTIVGLVASGSGVALVPASCETSAGGASSTKRCTDSRPRWNRA